MSVFTNSASSTSEETKAYTTAVLELLGSRDPLEVLSGTPSELEAALSAMSESELVEAEARGKWSVRHLVQHLADAELVWGYRLRMVLAHERPVLTGYDQDLWADRLGYAEADAARAVREFTVLRQSNLRLLARASAADLQRIGKHEERGEESLAYMIRLYAGHDLVHLRQLARIRAAVKGR
jgi:uncharacterized damage-inducible protein DinB